MHTLVRRDDPVRRLQLHDLRCLVDARVLRVDGAPIDQVVLRSRIHYEHFLLAVRACSCRLNLRLFDLDVVVFPAFNADELLIIQVLEVVVILVSSEDARASRRRRCSLTTRRSRMTELALLPILALALGECIARLGRPPFCEALPLLLCLCFPSACLADVRVRAILSLALSDHMIVTFPSALPISGRKRLRGLVRLVLGDLRILYLNRHGRLAALGHSIAGLHQRLSVASRLLLEDMLLGRVIEELVGVLVRIPPGHLESRKLLLQLV